MKSEPVVNVNTICEDITPECRPSQMIDFQHSGAALRKTAAVFSALGDPERLRILAILAERRHCVGALAEQTGESMSLISQRLKILHQADLVVRERNGRHVYYRTADERVVGLLLDGFESTVEKEHD